MYAKWLEEFMSLVEKVTVAEGSQSAKEALIEHAKRVKELCDNVQLDTVKAMAETLEIDGGDFYYNEPNNYGAVTTTIMTGAGDPWELFRGEEIQADYINGRRGTGQYKLNEKIVPVFMKKMKK